MHAPQELLATCALYGIVDLGYTAPDQAVSIASRLLEGGIRILQLRAKHAPAETILQLGLQLAPLCRERGALFVMNDFPELAVACGADAVHVGQDDGTLAGVRQIVGPGMLVGRSTHSPEQALKARAEGFDYIGFGPLYPTGTKPGRPAIGLQDICSVQEQLGDFPMFCIGGINDRTLPDVLSAGGRRVVVVSWLLQHPDPAAATRVLMERLAHRDEAEGAN